MLRRKKNYIIAKQRQNQENSFSNNGVRSQKEQQHTYPLGI